jgi:outer membrane receptor for ferrienterochelin and colicin
MVYGAVYRLALFPFLGCSAFAIPAALAQEAPKTEAQEVVVVRGVKAAVVRKDDRTVYNLGSNLQAVSGSVADVLSSLSSVSVDPNGGVRVHGESVSIYVDGRPAAAFRGSNLAAALQSMPANSIVQIEVITSPGPEFRSNTSAIINIVTKKPAGTGSKGEVLANVGRPHRRGTISFDGSTSIRKWRFGTTFGYRSDVRTDAINVDLRTFDAKGAEITQLSEYRTTFVPFTNITANASADYSISSKSKLNFSAEGALRDRPRRYTAVTILNRKPTGSITTGRTEDTADQSYDYYMLSGGYNRENLVGNDEFSTKISFENHLTDRVSTENFTFPQDPFADAALNQSWLQDERVYKASWDYKISLPGSAQLKLGGELERARTIIDFARARTFLQRISPPPLVTSTSIQSRYTGAYIDYKTKIKDWSIRGGVRYESENLNIRQDEVELSIRNRGGSWSPSLMLSSDLNSNTSVVLAYNRRLDRPNAESFSPLQLEVNTVTNLGNPNLKPETTDKFSAKYNQTVGAVNMSAEAFFIKAENEIINRYILPEPDQPNLVSTLQNATDGQKYGVDLAVKFPLSPSLTVNLDAEVFRGQRSLLVDEDKYQLKQTSYVLKALLTWNISPKARLQFNPQWYGRSLNSSGVADAYSSVNASFGYSLTPAYEIVANYTNITGPTTYGDIIRSARFIRQTELRVPGQIFFVGLKYKFGANGSAE